MSRVKPLSLAFATLLLLSWAMARPASAEVSGTVVNKTTGGPQPGVIVTLYSLGQTGMQPVKTVKSSPQGGFDIDFTPQGPHLVQTIHDGVVYSKMITPGQPSSGLELDVYDATNKSSEDAVTQHMVLVEPMGGILHVNESIVVDNPGNRTLNDPVNGALQVYIPSSIQGQPRLMATSPLGMPVQRDPVPTETADTYKIDYPVKPGETRFDLTYVLPKAEPLVFAGKVLHPGPVRIVAPNGVTLTGDAITQIGEEPQTHAKVYDVSGTEYSVTIEGTGSLSVPESAAASQGGGSSIEQIKARVYDRVYLIVGLALVILAAGFVLLYRRPDPFAGNAPGARAKPVRKRS